MRTLLCSLVFLLGCASFAGAKPLMVDAVQGSERLMPYFTWLPDPSGTQTIHSITSGSLQEHFSPLRGIPLRAKGPVWLRLVIMKSAPAGRPAAVAGAGLILNLGELPPGQTELYLPEEGALASSPQGGKEAVEAYSRETVASHEIVTLPTPGLLASSVYLRMEESPGLWFSPVVMPKGASAPPILPPELLLPGLLIAAMAACLLRAGRDRTGWPLWAALFLGCVLAQSLLPLPKLSGVLALRDLPALLAPGMALLLLPHVGRCMMRTSGQSLVQDAMLYLCSLLGAAVCLAPLVPGMNWLTRLFPLWPLLLLPLLPLCLSGLASKKPGSLAFSGVCFMPVIGAAIALYALENPSIHPLAPQGGLWGLAVGGLGLALARVPAVVHDASRNGTTSDTTGLDLAGSAVDAAKAEAAAASLSLAATASFSSKSQYDELTPLDVLLQGASAGGSGTNAASSGLALAGGHSESPFASFGRVDTQSDGAAEAAAPVPSASPDAEPGGGCSLVPGTPFEAGDVTPLAVDVFASLPSLEGEKSPEARLPVEERTPSEAQFTPEGEAAPDTPGELCSLVPGTPFEAGEVALPAVETFAPAFSPVGEAAPQGLFPVGEGTAPGTQAPLEKGASPRGGAAQEAHARTIPAPLADEPVSTAPLIPPCIDEGASVFGLDTVSPLEEAEAGEGPESAPRSISLLEDNFAAYTSDILEQLQEGAPRRVSQTTEGSFIFSLNSLVREVHDVVAPLAKNKGLLFSWFISPSLPLLLEGDAPRLRQALFLLLQNAVQSTSKGSVELAAKRLLLPDSSASLMGEEGCGLLFTVKDSGSAQRTDAGFFHAWEMAARSGGTFTVEYAPSVGTQVAFTTRFALPSSEAAARYFVQPAEPAGATAGGEAWAPAGSSESGAFPADASSGFMREGEPAFAAAPSGAAAFDVPDSFFAVSSSIFAGGVSQGMAPLSQALGTERSFTAADADREFTEEAGAEPRILATGMTTSNRRLLAHYLGKLPCKYGEAAGEEELLAALHRSFLALVIFDADMPEADLLRCLAALRSEERASGRAPTPVLVLTSHEAQTRRMWEAGCGHTLGKPFTQRALEEAVIQSIPSLAATRTMSEAGSETPAQGQDSIARAFVAHMRGLPPPVPPQARTVPPAAAPEDAGAESSAPVVLYFEEDQEPPRAETLPEAPEAVELGTEEPLDVSVPDGSGSVLIPDVPASPAFAGREGPEFSRRAGPSAPARPVDVLAAALEYAPSSSGGLIREVALPALNEARGGGPEPAGKEAIVSLGLSSSPSAESSTPEEVSPGAEVSAATEFPAVHTHPDAEAGAPVDASAEASAPQFPAEDSPDASPQAAGQPPVLADTPEQTEQDTQNTVDEASAPAVLRVTFSRPRRTEEPRLAEPAPGAIPASGEPASGEPVPAPSVPAAPGGADPAAGVFAGPLHHTDTPSGSVAAPGTDVSGRESHAMKVPESEPGATDKETFADSAAPMILGLSSDDVTPHRFSAPGSSLLDMICTSEEEEGAAPSATGEEPAALAGDFFPGAEEAGASSGTNAAWAFEGSPFEGGHEEAEPLPDSVFSLPGVEGEAIEQTMIPLIPGLIHSLRDAVDDAVNGRDAGETLLIQEATGRLAGKAEIFALHRLGKIARCVERAAEADDMEAAATLLEDLSSVTGRYIVALQECYHAFLNPER